MRLLCPFCQQVITLPDSQAGKAVNCPLCTQAFQAPQPYIPLAANPPTPEPTPLPAPIPFAASPPPGVTNPLPTGPVERTQKVDVTPVSTASISDLPQRTFDQMPSIPGVPPRPGTFRGLTLRPELLAWLPAIALTLAFLLTFFRWAGSYPAGYTAYTQNGWQALFAGFSQDPVAEDVMKLQTEIKDHLKSNWYLLFYFPMLIAGIVVAWAGIVITGLKIKLPEVAEKLWPYRPALLAIFSVFTMLILSVQWVSGFGIEHSITELVEKKHLDDKNAANTPEKMQRWEMGRAKELGGFYLQTTTWLRLVWLSHLVAALAVGLEAICTLRGKSVPIRVGLQW